MKKFSMLLLILGLCAQGSIVLGLSADTAAKISAGIYRDYALDFLKTVIGDSIIAKRYNDALALKDFPNFLDALEKLNENEPIFKVIDDLNQLEAKTSAGNFREGLRSALNDPNNALGQIVSGKLELDDKVNFRNYLKGLVDTRDDWDLGEGLGSLFADEEEVAVSGAAQQAVQGAAGAKPATISRRALVLNAERAWRAGQAASQKAAPAVQAVKAPAPAVSTPALSRKAQILQAERAWRASHQRR